MLQIAPASASAAALRRAPGDERAGAAIGAGVVAAMRGVGLLEADAIDRRRQRGRGDLAMHGRGAVAEFGGADREVEAAVVAQRNAQSAKWPAGGTVSIMVSAMPSPISQSAESSASAPVGHRALDQIEALVEPIAAIEHVVIFGFRRRQHGIAGLDDIAAAHLERV